MKIDKKRFILISIILFSCFSGLMAQHGGGFDPNEMILREKQNLYREVASLSDDQRMLIDGIYDEFAQSLTELREEVQKTRNWEEMRPKMQALRAEKDGLMVDVLNEEQYAIYNQLSEGERVQRENRRREFSPPVN
ncbi:MAG: hypothetical protein O2887_19230 [Bacteroidetes bacterium]|nr:hypothetical protein [Bacteroidota bacterium]MDA1122586.1 hypothetical protein [Bacteroidota bacterium]